MHLGELFSNLPPLVERALTAFKTGTISPKSHAAVSQVGLDGPDAAPVRLSLTRSNHLLRPHEVAELVTAYQDGASLQRLSRDFSLHEQTVRAHLERSGVILRPWKVLTQDQVPAVIQRYADGRSLRELSVEFGVSNGTIRNYLLKAGVVMRPARRPMRQAASDAASD
ncbi:hypothetical protein SAMN05444157_0742 [Frankineae bacterium MT45]|nr:hypothetical protein SAMN05444157_0742 [Frankineae bacterium MT45]